MEERGREDMNILSIGDSACPFSSRREQDEKKCESMSFPAGLGSLIPLRVHIAHRSKGDFSAYKYLPIIHSLWVQNISQLDPMLNGKQ